MYVLASCWDEGAVVECVYADQPDLTREDAVWTIVSRGCAQLAGTHSGTKHTFSEKRQQFASYFDGQTPDLARIDLEAGLRLADEVRRRPPNLRSY